MAEWTTLAAWPATAMPGRAPSRCASAWTSSSRRRARRSGAAGGSRRVPAGGRRRCNAAAATGTSWRCRCMSISHSNIDAEINAAFAAGAMPPEWRPRLLASGMNDNDVRVTAAAIADTHRILQDTWWSNQNVVFEAVGVLGSLFIFAFAIVFHKTKGLMLTFFIWGLLPLAATFLLAVLDGCERRRARLIRDVVRKVLENFLLPPV
uniref:Uncharacterized protein n=1 Tax=Oryza punctata TaxID=4537 RepID=A0A0E0M484_ORYPU